MVREHQFIALALARQMPMRQTRKPLIAIVDDDPRVLRAIRRIAWTRGIDAEIFESGRGFIDALDTVPAFRPECVIVDMHMPGMNGLDVLRHLVRTRPEVPVIFLSGTCGERDYEEALNAGALAFFRKPLMDDMEVLLGTLHALLKMKPPERH